MKENNGLKTEESEAIDLSPTNEEALAHQSSKKLDEGKFADKENHAENETDDGINSNNEDESDSGSENDDESSENDDESSENDNENMNDSENEGMSSYEKLRLERIRRNNEKLAQLGLNSCKGSGGGKKSSLLSPLTKEVKQKKPKKSISRTPVKKSTREKKAVNYSESSFKFSYYRGHNKGEKEQPKKMNKGTKFRVPKFIYEEFQRMKRQRIINIRNAERDKRDAERELKFARHQLKISESQEKKLEKERRKAESDEIKKIYYSVMEKKNILTVLYSDLNARQLRRMTAKTFEYNKVQSIIKNSPTILAHRQELMLKMMLDEYKSLKAPLKQLKGMKVMDVLETISEGKKITKPKPQVSKDNSVKIKISLRKDDGPPKIITPVEMFNDRPTKAVRNVGGPIDLMHTNKIDRSWLEGDSAVVPSPTTIYIPQVGDTVLYYPSGHKSFLENNSVSFSTQIKTKTRQPIWQRYGWDDDFFRNAGDCPILCKVKHTYVEFPPSIPQQRNKGKKLSTEAIVRLFSSDFVPLALNVALKPLTKLPIPIKSPTPKNTNQSPTKVSPQTYAKSEIPINSTSNISKKEYRKKDDTFRALIFPSNDPSFIVPFVWAYKQYCALSLRDCVKFRNRSSSTDMESPEWITGRIVSISKDQSDAARSRSKCIPLDDLRLIQGTKQHQTEEPQTQKQTEKDKINGSSCDTLLSDEIENWPKWNCVTVSILGEQEKECRISPWELILINEEDNGQGTISIKTRFSGKPRPANSLSSNNFTKQLLYTMNESIRKKLEEVLTSFLKKDNLKPFVKRITKVTAPLYYTVVPLPMYIEKILRRLKVTVTTANSTSCYYRSTGALMSDLYEIINNCLLYNNPRSTIVADAVQFGQDMKNIIADIERHYKTEQKRRSKPGEKHSAAQCTRSIDWDWTYYDKKNALIDYENLVKDNIDDAKDALQHGEKNASESIREHLSDSAKTDNSLKIDSSQKSQDERRICTNSKSMKTNSSEIDPEKSMDEQKKDDAIMSSTISSKQEETGHMPSTLEMDVIKIHSRDNDSSISLTSVTGTNSSEKNRNIEQNLCVREMMISDEIIASKSEKNCLKKESCDPNIGNKIQEDIPSMELSAQSKPRSYFGSHLGEENDKELKPFLRNELSSNKSFDWIPQGGDQIFYNKFLHRNFISYHQNALNKMQQKLPSLPEIFNASDWISGCIQKVRYVFPELSEVPPYSFQKSSPLLVLNLSFDYDRSINHVVHWRPCQLRSYNRPEKKYPISPGKCLMQSELTLPISSFNGINSNIDGINGESINCIENCLCGLNYCSSFIHPAWLHNSLTMSCEASDTGYDDESEANTMPHSDSSEANIPAQFDPPSGILISDEKRIANCIEVLRERCTNGAKSDIFDFEAVLQNVENHYFENGEENDIIVSREDKECTYNDSALSYLCFTPFEDKNRNMLSPGICLNLILRRIKNRYYRQKLGIIDDLYFAFAACAMNIMQHKTEKISLVLLSELHAANSQSSFDIQAALPPGTRNTVTNSKHVKGNDDIKDKGIRKKATSKLTSADLEIKKRIECLWKLFCFAVMTVDCTDEMEILLCIKEVPLIPETKSFTTNLITTGRLLNVIAKDRTLNHFPIANGTEPYPDVKVKIKLRDSAPIDNHLFEPIRIEPSIYERNDILAKALYGTSDTRNPCVRCCFAMRNLLYCRVRKGHSNPDFDMIKFAKEGGIDKLISSLKTDLQETESSNTCTSKNVDIEAQADKSTESDIHDSKTIENNETEKKLNGVTLTRNQNVCDTSPHPFEKRASDPISDAPDSFENKECPKYDNNLNQEKSPDKMLEMAEYAVLLADFTLKVAQSESEAPALLSEEFVRQQFPVDEDDGHYEFCIVCGVGGDVLCCESCPSVAHKNCMNLENVPEGDWFCPFCINNECDPTQAKNSMDYATDSKDSSTDKEQTRGVSLEGNQPVKTEETTVTTSTNKETEQQKERISLQQKTEINLATAIKSKSSIKEIEHDERINVRPEGTEEKDANDLAHIMESKEENCEIIKAEHDDKDVESNFGTEKNDCTSKKMENYNDRLVTLKANPDVDFNVSCESNDGNDENLFSNATTFEDLMEELMKYRLAVEELSPKQSGGKSPGKKLKIEMPQTEVNTNGLKDEGENKLDTLKSSNANYINVDGKPAKEPKSSTETGANSAIEIDENVPEDFANQDSKSFTKEDSPKIISDDLKHQNETESSTMIKNGASSTGSTQANDIEGESEVEIKIGTRILKSFDKQGIFEGVVQRMPSKRNSYYKVKYNDGDDEEMSDGEVRGYAREYIAKRKSLKDTAMLNMKKGKRKRKYAQNTPKRRRGRPRKTEGVAAKRGRGRPRKSESARKIKKKLTKKLENIEKSLTPMRKLEGTENNVRSPESEAEDAEENTVAETNVEDVEKTITTPINTKIEESPTPPRKKARTRSRPKYFTIGGM